MKKNNGRTRVTIDEAKKLKGNSNLAKLYNEQEKERSRREDTNDTNEEQKIAR